MDTDMNFHGKMNKMPMMDTQFSTIVRASKRSEIQATIRNIYLISVRQWERTFVQVLPPFLEKTLERKPFEVFSAFFSEGSGRDRDLGWGECS